MGSVRALQLIEEIPLPYTARMLASPHRIGNRLSRHKDKAREYRAKMDLVQIHATADSATAKVHTSACKPKGTGLTPQGDSKGLADLIPTKPSGR